MGTLSKVERCVWLFIVSFLVTLLIGVNHIIHRYDQLLKEANNTIDRLETVRQFDYVQSAQPANNSRIYNVCDVYDINDISCE